MSVLDVSTRSPQPHHVVANPIGLLAYNIDTFASLLPLSNLSGYRVISVFPGTSSEVFLSATAGQQRIFYTSPIDGWTAGSIGHGLTGVSYESALANGWLTHAGGVPLQTYYSSYILDCGAPAMQSLWVSNVLAYLAAHPILTGIFIDQCLWDIANASFDFLTYPDEYPSQASYLNNATLPFLRYAVQAIQAAGYYVLASAGGYSHLDVIGSVNANNNLSMMNALLGVCRPESIMCEGWMNGDGVLTMRDQSQPLVNGNGWYGTPVGAGSSVWANGWMRLPQLARQAGVGFVGLTYDLHNSGAVAQATMMYARAAQLLDWNGIDDSSFWYGSKDFDDPYSVYWTWRLGRPVTGVYRVGQGFARAFTEGDYPAGLVLLNPTPGTSQDFPLPSGTWTDPSGATHTSSVTLTATTALILHT